MRLPQLNLPEIEPKIQTKGNSLEIFDPCRKKYVALTPEEWVRQNFLGFMIEHLRYPKSLVMVEGALKYNRLNKRPDIVAMDRNGNPLLVVECKSVTEKVGQKTFEQVAVYNKVLKARYMVVTNGMQHYCCEQDFEAGTSRFLNEIPAFKD